MIRKQQSGEKKVIILQKVKLTYLMRRPCLITRVFFFAYRSATTRNDSEPLCSQVGHHWLVPYSAIIKSTLLPAFLSARRNPSFRMGS